MVIWIVYFVILTLGPKPILPYTDHHMTSRLGTKSARALKSKKN